MASLLKRLLIGKPIATEHQHHERLNNITALAVFSSDALSSVAYATEAILAVLIVGGASALGLGLPIAGGISFLLLVVAISYRQTIHAYPNGGGAYIVAHENLGQLPGLIAAAALLIDYVLTVAVSISAGVAAITSLATNWGAPWLAQYAVEIALLCILVVGLANLRGVKESGAVFAVPTYLFIVCILAMVAWGVGRMLLGTAQPVVQAVAPELHAGEALGLWLVLRAFAAGCTALTGVEAISNGIPAFKHPEAKNAATTLSWMVGILGTMFLGITWLADRLTAVPNEVTHETIVSQIARTVFGVGPVYTIIQVATALILVLAANTAYADFPRLASLLAKDRFLPRQFSSRGDRLVFSNGIVVLSLFAAGLVVFFRANEIAMLPLYAIGVFLSFTLSQGGMVIHHLREKEPGWRLGLGINGLGAGLTAVVLVVLVMTKFTHGAWVVLVLIPLLVVIFQAIHRHYVRVAAQLSLANATKPKPVRRLTAVVLVSGLHKGTLPALQIANALAPNNVTAVTVNMDAEYTERIHARWQDWGCDVPLVVLDSPYRSLITPLLKYIAEVDGRYHDDEVMVILPEFVPAHWWEHLLHNQTGLILRTALMFRAGKIVVSVPYKLEQ
ncbi:APC family permease [Candidatus Chloroploca sp. Khr17]|uniref:APC family permease n=1 Tax=Candidatus Chloroploca sp. Khr17 TaxID=2496869 RepID=UPI00101DAD3B|nr:APC family permease [Candidatus Chloroploca sp. Khr17]